ncbi:hypothetical protein FOXYS1_47 [Fusarium oxysporum]|uniref:Fum3 n=1 Tax=Fusarium oxysporum TaxID=5507 RepID=B2CGF9_FUSOX|nr:Fum3 [Fusarium oxysporum]KAF5269052.1 hypothetical protein FOXYS1_47 [Fusarium oxysporum]
MNKEKVPQTAVPNGRTKLHQVTSATPLDEVFQYWEEDGAIVIKGLLTSAQVEQLNQEMDPILQKVAVGGHASDVRLQNFHGMNTKRAGDLTNNSAVFRDHLLDNEFIHAVSQRCFAYRGKLGQDAYWLSSASTIHVGPGQKPQTLHRDLGSYPIFWMLGQEGPEAQINFLVATTDFTEANGATRIIPGSHKWEFNQHGDRDMTIAAEMEAGDCLLISGKVVHGTGENKTDQERGCLAVTICANFLAPEEAHPFIVSMDTAKKLPVRSQRCLGFRSQWPRSSPGLWTKDYSELALHLGLDD